MLKYIVFGVIALAVIGGFLYWKFGPPIGQKQQQSGPITLTVFGLWEEENLVKPAIDEFKKTHPDSTIKYVYQSSQNYRSRVQTQIKENQGPDILMIHNSWLPMFLKTNSLTEAPSDVYSLDEFTKTFYPVTKTDFTKEGKIYAVPRGIDGLALYYNEEILEAAGVSPPVNWEQLRDAAIKVTVAEKQEGSDEIGKITTAGVAMGTAGNVDHWSDIIALLFLQQPGASLENPTNDASAAVLKFYTDFVLDRQRRVWDPNWENSTQAFASGKLGFYFAPSWRAHELRQINPELKFKIISVPQLSGKKAGYANYWGYAVSSKTPHPKEAWEFLKFLSSAEAEKLLYQQASNTPGRLFGLPYSRADLKNEVSADPLVGAFVNQGPDYKSWYLSSSTRDQGLNDEMIKYFEDAVNAVLSGTSPKNALSTTAQGVNQVLEKYGVKEAAVPAE